MIGTVKRERVLVDARCVCSADQGAFSDLNAAQHDCSASPDRAPEQRHATSEIQCREFHEKKSARRMSSTAPVLLTRGQLAIVAFSCSVVGVVLGVLVMAVGT